MKAVDCAQALLVLQNKATIAAVGARDGAALLSVQRDIVTGAQRLEAACARLGADAATTAQVREYRQAAEAALARLEAPRRRAFAWRGR